MKSPLCTAIVALLAAATLAGCATSKSGSTYSREQARSEMTVRTGVIESIRPVNLEGTKTGTGTMAGAAVGGVAGSGVGGGKGQIIGAVVGAVMGGVAGNAIEEHATTKPALEITVKLDGGQTIAVVQEAEQEEFHNGERVRILSRYGESRVSH